MSILDTTLEYSDGYALSAGDGATDVVDHKAGGDALVNELTLVALATVAGAGGTSAVMKFQTSDDSAFGTATDLYVSPSVALADIKAGATLAALRMPRGLKRYSRWYVDVTGTFTAGTIRFFAVTADQYSFGDM